MFEAVTAFCEKAIEERMFPGCAVGIIFRETIWKRGFGRHTYEADATPVTEDTIYDVASITKAIPVSLLALQCIENGVLHFDDPLIAVVPEFSGSYRDRITIRHLLTHTLDFGFQLSAYKDLGSAALIEKIFSAPLRSPPGNVFAYANATSILLGLVVERLAGLPLDEIADKKIFRPLGMYRTTFHPEAFDNKEIVPTEHDDWRGRMVHGEVHDESAYALRPRLVGSAGLFSSVSDLLKCIAMLLGEGRLGNENRLFDLKTVALMHTDSCPAPGACTGMGWELNQPHFMGMSCNEDTFGKTGFTGCSMVIDPTRKVGIVLLSNHVFPRRHKDRTLINTIRSRLADIVFAATDTSR